MTAGKGAAPLGVESWAVSVAGAGELTAMACESAHAVETHRTARMVAQAVCRAALTRSEYRLRLLLSPGSGMVRTSCPRLRASAADARPRHRRLRPGGRRTAGRAARAGPRGPRNLREPSSAAAPP